MSSYYQGQRRFALGGKGWTAVLGTIVSLAYIRAKAAVEGENTEQAYQKLEDNRGKQVPFSDQPEMPGKREDIVLRIWRRLPEVPLPNLYVAGGLLTAFWAYRMWGVFNRLMVIRYADVSYQLRRPDVLANKVVALKYLALPLAAVPCAALGLYGLTSVAVWGEEVQGQGSRQLVSDLLRRQAAALRETMDGPCTEARRIAHDAVDPFASDLSSGPLATFARRSQTVGLVSMPKPGDIVAPPRS
eukprot:TRINITY_DN79377_c0_g1_i1.p1 TRINITY_DN79377_c0_g1~~TRINITY_DN79377_c0_g1_i1.p1  ORF type:complete len:244 (-),score=33.34 TRINITY_DN79377_c0_g1_i1:78-809(-)